MKINNLYFFICFACYAYTVSADITCSTITNAISNVTDCVGGTCTIHYSTVVTADLSNGFSSCLKFGALKDGNVTMLNEINFNLTVAQAGHEVPLELQYITGDVNIQFDSYCTCDPFTPTTDCSGMTFQNIPRLTACLIKHNNAPNCLIKGSYSYAQKVGIDLDQRFKVFLARNPTLEVDLHYSYNNISKGIVWNAETPTHISISSEIGIDLLSSSHDSTPEVPRYLVYDMKVPYDLYDATTFNQAGEFSSEKPGSIYWLPDGTFKYRLENFDDKWSSTLTKCSHDRTTTSLDLRIPTIQTVLENFRLSNNSMRNQFPRIIYFDFNSAYDNDYWTSTSKNPSHILDAKNPGSVPKMNNYIMALNSNGFMVRVGVINTQCYFNEQQVAQNTQVTIWDCNQGNFLIKCDAGSGWSWYNAGATAWSYGNNTYMDWQGNCRATNFGIFPPFNPIHDDEHYLFLPFANTGSFNYRVSGKVPGISFTSQLCPDILSVKDDPANHIINMTARSTCGSGVVLITSNNSMSHSSDTLSLTASYQTFAIPRNFNISGYVQIGLASGNKYQTKVIFLNYFPYNDPVDDDGTGGTPNPDQPQDEDHTNSSIFGSWSSFWSNVKDAFHWKWLDWKSIIFKIVVLIVIVALSILSIVVLYKIIKYLVTRFMSKKTKYHQL